MDDPSKSQLSKRVLKFNVGFLLSDGPAHNHNSKIDFPQVLVSDDLTLKYLRGPMRLSRTKEGVLVQAEFETAIDGSCYRCLDPHQHPIMVELEELFGYKSEAETEFRIADDAMLDLAPLLREEVLIEADYGRPFRADPNGICRMCGVAIEEKLRVNEEEHIDPRLAVLKKLLDSE